MVSRTLVLASLLALTAASADAQRLRFSNVTTAAGLDAVNIQGGGPGMAVGDFDGDGWLDLTVSGSIDARPRLFWNNGERVTAGHPEPWFVEVSDHLPSDRVPSSLAMFADLDNDFDLDLVVVERAYDANTDTWKNNWTGLACFENLNGSYRRLATDPTLGFAKKKNGGLALADCDLDGDLDMVFTHSSPGALNDPGAPAFYIRNDAMTFVDDTASFGLNKTRYFSAVLADFNGDMKPDLHCAVDFYKDIHQHWVGPGQYVNVNDQTGANNTGSDMGLAVGDIENDGDLDIYSTNIATGVLYVNDGVGNFTQEQGMRGVSAWPGFPIGWGTAFVDFDLDMDEDLVFVAGGSSPGLIYSNDGDGYFTDQTVGSGLYLKGHGLVPFDFDRDGDQDFIMWRTGNGRPRLYRNDTFGNKTRNWLVVRPVGNGTTTPVDGVGARVRVSAGGVTQTRHILAGYSFKSGPPMEAHFGLGSNGLVDRIEVTWPDGDTQVLTNVGANEVVRVNEL